MDLSTPGLPRSSLWALGTPESPLPLFLSAPRALALGEVYTPFSSFLAASAPRAAPKDPEGVFYFPALFWAAFSPGAAPKDPRGAFVRPAFYFGPMAGKR